MLTRQEQILILALAEHQASHHISIVLELIRVRDAANKAALDHATQKDFAQSQLDNRNRRMQIAAWILDEENTPDLEMLASILWPAENGPVIQFGSLLCEHPPYAWINDFKESGHIRRHCGKCGHQEDRRFDPCDGNHAQATPCGDPECWLTR